jgi:integrase/recombinase XerD
MTGIAFSEALVGYRLNVEARGLSEHTIADYWNTYRKFTAYLTGDPLLSDITVSQIEGFLAAQKEVSNKTKYNYHINLAALWTWAVKKGVVASNILHEIDRPKPEERAIIPLTEADIRRVLEALIYTKEYTRPGKRASRHKLPNAERNRAIVLLLLDTGIRASELCGMTIKDIDFRNRHIKVFGKGSKERSLPICARTGEMIWKYLSSRRDDRTNSPLFTTEDNHPLDRMGLLHLLGRAGERAEVEDVHPHRFRHTFAVTFLRNGGDAYALQEMLGHTSMEMVKIYLEIAQADLDRNHRRASPVENWRL